MITCKGAVASNYAISYHIGMLTVLREDVAFVYGGAASFAHGATVRLRAVLETDALSTQKVNGQKVTLGFKGARGCATTTNSGVAICSIKAPARAGPAMVFMSYAGNTYHLPDSQLANVTIS